MNVFLEMADVTHFLKFLAGLQADMTIAVFFCYSFFVSFTAINIFFTSFLVTIEKILSMNQL